MHARIGLVAVALAAVASPSAALDVVLAPLVVQDEAGSGSERPAPSKPEADLLRALDGLRGGGRPLVRRMNPPSNAAPRSLLDAARLCESHACGRLLYGWVRRTENALHAEIKLFDSEPGEIVAVFFGSDDDLHYDRLMADVAAKIVDWFRDETGYAPAAVRPRERNLLSMPCSIGAWTPLGGRWNRVTAGLAAVGVGARLVPVRPLFHVGTSPAEVAAAVDLEYALGRNERGYESFFVHLARVRLTAEASIAFASRMSLAFGLGPLLAVDTMAQDRLYDDEAVETAVAAGVSFVLSCRYRASASLALGLANVVDIAAYDDPLAVYSPRLFADISLSGGSRGGGGGAE